MLLSPEKQKRLGRLTCSLLRSWFELTSRERKAVVIVLGLFTLGVIARLWHSCLANGR